MKEKFKKEFKYLILLLLLLVGAVFPLLKSGFFLMHDDLQVMRLFEMEKCFNNGQIPCRWVSDMGAGYGFPLYNYYSVFPYYLGMVFRAVGFSYIFSVKMLFILSFLLSGFFVYFLLKEFFNRWAAIIGAVFFVYAPYHAVDVYVRGAMTESWGVVFFPAIFLCLYKYIKEEKLIWFALGALSLSGLFLSHNIMTLVFTPFAVVWAFFWLVKLKKIKLIWKSALIFVWAFGLSSFFLIPAFLEQKYIKLDALVSDYYSFQNHFATIKQLFIDRSFGYGPSRYGPVDDMSFQLGFPHWILVLISGVTSFVLLLKKKKEYLVTVLMFVFWGTVVFMTHGRSVFIWKSLPLIKFVQFPWRFLALAMFFGSFLVASLVFVFKKYQPVIFVLFVGLIIVLNINYFRPEKYFPDATDQKILFGQSWQTQSMAALLDYLPNQVKTVPETLAPSSPWVIQGEAQISEFKKRSDFWRFTIDSSNLSGVTVRVPVFDFPNWTVLIDQQSVVFGHANDLGVIEILIPVGKHTVVGWFRNTPLRLISNLISIISFSVLIIFLALQRQRKNE